jgi:hypothetical protein
MIRFLLSASLLVCCSSLYGQEPDTTLVEEDFSMYGDAELADGAKRFCTNKVLDQSPNKLISLGYDFQGAHDLSFGSWGSTPAARVGVKSAHGIRINSNFPVISRANLLLNVGVNYWETNYQIESSESHPISAALQSRGLRTTGITATLFKPFNEKRFLLLQSVFDLNGDYFLPDFQALTYTRISPTMVYGWKKHDRLMYGFGVSGTYRVGEPNVIPVFLYNYTSPSRKWGIESVFPARANFRRTFNTRTLAFFGYELEGQTYRMSTLKGVEGIVNPELRRGELRIRMTFERSIKNFVWLSAQAGLRYPTNFNLDDGNIFRGFGDTPYTLENELQNAFYFNLSVNLVSP